jgi:PleD family two-component response regulator
MAPFLAAADKRLPPPVHLHIARLGEQALQILEQPDFKPDLNHPGFEGYAVLALYPPKKDKTPVVGFSASDNEADVSRGCSLGVEDFISLAHDPFQVRRAAMRFLSRPTGPEYRKTLDRLGR